MSRHSPIHRRQHGIGMLEVLIAVLIVSIGFLGMAALQARALSTNNSAMARSMATVASYSILDAMRADLASAEANGYNYTVTANACSSVAASGLAKDQLTSWCNQLGDRLGAAATTTGQVACTPVTTATTATADCTVTITYADSRSVAMPTAASTSGSSASTQYVVTRAQL